MVPPGLTDPAAPPPPIRLVVLCGPTGSGKGGLARRLAAELGAEILSADSRKVYRGLDIGTAKPDASARAQVAHHLIDVVEPDESFSAARFVTLADEAIADITWRGRRVVVVGGTGLYLRALLHGIISTPPSDDALRARLERQEAGAPGSLHARLAELDPIAARRLPAGDVLRLVRALEVIELTGQSLSAIQAAHGFRPQRYPALLLAPDWPRSELDARIDRRVERLMAKGWLAEVQRLREQGHVRALAVVGYRQLARHLDGDCSLAQAVADIQAAHRRYARQQRTWFKAIEDLRWLPTPVDEDALQRDASRFWTQPAPRRSPSGLS